MNINELFDYFLEKEGYLFKNFDKKMELLSKVNKEFCSNRTKKGKIRNEYDFLEYLEGNVGCVIDEFQLEEDFKNYKTVVLHLLEEIPDDYDLKSDLVFDGIDFENNSDEENFKVYKSNRIHKVIMQEIKNENDIGEISSEDLNKVIDEKFKEYDFTPIEKDAEAAANKLEEYLEEIYRINLERKTSKMYFSNFVLGRMYLRTTRKLLHVYDSFGDKEKLKEKSSAVWEAFANDNLHDRYDFCKEAGFISYELNDMNSYEGLCRVIKVRKRDELATYILKNYSNIFDNPQNDEYIKGIIKRNFVFLPILMFRTEAGIGGRNIINPSKGSYEEAIQMIYYFFKYAKNTFTNCEDNLIKDYAFSIENYFNYYFNDNGVTYSLFGILEKFFDSIDDDFYIDDLEKNYIEECRFIEHEEFEKAFQNLCKTKLIKKVKKTMFIFNFPMEWMIDFDLNGGEVLKEKMKNKIKEMTKLLEY